MPRLFSAAKRLLRNLSNVWSAEHDLRAGGPDGVGHLICSRSHPRHCADSNKPNVMVAYKPRHFIFGHRLSIAVNEKHFVPWRCEALQQKHPEVRHEITGNTVVGTVKENVQVEPPFTRGKACMSGRMVQDATAYRRWFPPGLSIQNQLGRYHAVPK